MSLTVHEKRVRGYWLTSLADADLEQVTTGEITAGTFLGTKMTVDGINQSPTRNKASAVLMDTGQISQAPGTRSQDIVMRFFRDTAEDADTAWELFEYDTQGFLVVARLRFNAAPEEGDRVEIYKGATFEPNPMATAQDTYQQYEVELAVEKWELKATVVAGS